MAVTTLLGLPIPNMSETVGKTIPDLASAMQMIDEKLGGSRIVDHNLDVVAPPNGYYWRTEDGRQVCWGRVLTVWEDASTKSIGVQLPAIFASVPAAAILRESTAGGSSYYLDGFRYSSGYSQVVFYYKTDTSLNGDVFFSFMAIGTWK